MGAGEPLCRDWRYTFSAILLAGLTLLTLMVPTLREFYELSPLSLTDILFLIAVALEWGLIQRAIWRSRFFDQFLGIDLR